MAHWDEIRTAYQVVEHGTVSGAAAALGVHHATVIRQIDLLESHLGVKLFQRHARGYTPTEAGADLARVARVTEDQFAQLDARIRGQGEAVSGELVVTALSSMAPWLMPAIVSFRAQYPGVRLRLATGSRLFRLEYGEAHVAVRAGAPPEEPDNVVQPFRRVRFGLYGAQSYVERRGMPRPDDLAAHDFVSQDETSRAPFARWIGAHIPDENVVFRATDDASLTAALRAGIGLGFTGESIAGDLVEVLAPRPEWETRSWLVTHVDQHRSAKVQAFLAHLKALAKTSGA